MVQTLQATTFQGVDRGERLVDRPNHDHRGARGDQVGKAVQGAGRETKLKISLAQLP